MTIHTGQIVRSGGPECGVTLYCERIFEHPFDGFEIVLVVHHWKP